MIGRVAEKIDMLDRHLDVLEVVIGHEPIGIVRTANELDYPHHKVRYSFRVLEDEGLIESSSRGAITTERTNEVVSEFNERLTAIEATLSGLTDIAEDEQSLQETDSPAVVQTGSY